MKKVLLIAIMLLSVTFVSANNDVETDPNPIVKVVTAETSLSDVTYQAMLITFKRDFTKASKVASGILCEYVVEGITVTIYDWFGSYSLQLSTSSGSDKPQSITQERANELCGQNQ